MPWSSDNKDIEDKEAFVFSLTNEMCVFKPKNHSVAVLHYNWNGPSFDNTLAVEYTMNNKNLGYCATEGGIGDHAQYCVPKDSQGNSILTDDNGSFTCVEMEVFLI